MEKTLDETLDENGKPKVDLEKDPLDGVDVTSLDESSRKVIQSLSAQKAHWRSKAQTASKEAEDRANQLALENANLKRALEGLGGQGTPAPAKPAAVTPPEGGKPQATPFDEAWAKRTDFLVRHRDFSSEDITELEAISRGHGISLEEAVNSKSFQGYVALKEKERASVDATPKNGAGSPRATSNEVTLSEEDKITAARMGIPEDKFLESKKKMAAAKG